MHKDTALTPSRIVVATDLSAAADDALRVAHARAIASGAKLAVVHVVPHRLGFHPLFPQLSQPEAEAMVAAEGQAAQQVSQHVEAVLGSGAEAVDVHVDFGEPYVGVLRLAERLEAQLLVVGARGASDVPRMLFGSVAERIVRHAHCQVLVTRSNSTDGPIVAATDLSDPGAKAVAIAVDEAKHRSARLLLVHDLDIWPGGVFLGLGPLGPVPPAPDIETMHRVQQAAEEMLRSLLEGLDGQGEVRVTTEGRAGAAIVRLADEVGASLVIVGAHGRSGLARLALGSVAEWVVRHAHCSVLAVRH